MKKLINSIIFLGFCLLLLVSAKAENITYYSPEGSVITYSEYKKLCKAKKEKFAELREIVNKIKLRKSESKKALPTPIIGSQYVNKTMIPNRASVRSNRYPQPQKEKMKKKQSKEDEQKQIWAMERERMKRKYESEMPGLVYETSPAEKPLDSDQVSLIERQIEEDEIAERRKFFRLKSAGNCPAPLVKIYDNRTGDLKCVHRVIANNLASADYDIEIIE